MHSAPALTYPVGRSRFHGWLLGLTGLGAVLVGWLWCYQADSVGWRQGLYAVTTLGVGLAAVQAWRHSPRGNLQWDGQAWNWAAVATPHCGLVTVHLDLQFCLLLCLRTDNGTRIWLWPERSGDTTRWDALRRAVFSHGAAGQAPDAAVDAHRTQVKF